jgi:hypothetical protein
MTRGAELGRALLRAEVVHQDFEQVAFHVGVLRHERHGADQVYHPAQRCAIGNDERRAGEHLAHALRKFGVLGQPGEQVAHGAEHPLVIGIGAKVAPAQAFEFALKERVMRLAQVARVLLGLRVPFFQHLQEQQVRDLRDVGDRVGDIGCPAHFAQWRAAPRMLIPPVGIKLFSTMIRLSRRTV